MTHRPSRTRFLPLLGLSLAVGCPGPGPRTRLGTEPTDDLVVAPTPGSPAYSTRPPSGEPMRAGGDHGAVERGIASAASTRAVTLTGDPRLGELAEWVAARLGPAGEPPSAELLDFYAWHLGLVEPTPHVMVLGLPHDASIEEHVQRSAAQFLGRQAYTHWGASVIPRSGLWLVVVTFSSRHLELSDLPRTQAPGTPVRVQGRLLAGYRNPTLVVQRPGGEVTRLAAGTGPEFDVRVPTTEGGRHQVEVLARGPLGEEVLANVPVYFGQEPPQSIRPNLEDTSGGEAPDVGRVGTQLLDLLDRSRAEVGLAPLVRDARLDAVARAHSDDMHAHDFVGHVSPSTGSAGDRVQAAGLRSGLILENIGRGYSAAEIHRGLLDSPGHRANLVNPSATHVGIGVVAEPGDGRTAFLVTQVFLEVAREIDTAAAPADVLGAVNRARRARGAPELRVDPSLERAAADAARAYFASPGPSQQDTVEGATAGLRGISIAYRRLGGVMAVVSSLEEAQQLEPALDDTVRVCGIGVAQGTRADSVPNALAVVILLGWER
jgi:uncharacterized protein YkwD